MRRILTYERCYLGTVGVLFLGAFCYVIFQRGILSELPILGLLFLVILPVVGIGSIWVALGTSGKRVQQWMDSMWRHEASIVVMLVALPVYVFVLLFEDRR